jgi:hypothetical protein
MRVAGRSPFQGSDILDGGFLRRQWILVEHDQVRKRARVE